MLDHWIEAQRAGWAPRVAVAARTRQAAASVLYAVAVQNSVSAGTELARLRVQRAGLRAAEEELARQLAGRPLAVAVDGDQGVTLPARRTLPGGRIAALLPPPPVVSQAVPVVDEGARP